MVTSWCDNGWLGNFNVVSQKTRHIKQKGILVNKKLPNIALIYNLSQASVILTKKNHFIVNDGQRRFENKTASSVFSCFYTEALDKQSILTSYLNNFLRI